MPVERHRAPVTISTVLRCTLAHARHREIDAILKDLRICSRRLKSALDSFKDELRTLERLYYKCKNQHRSALFFKRVSETRRYGQRLIELDILERVDLLRASFVGLAHTGDQKALRSSWSRVPDKPYVHFLTERLAACSALARKMRERLAKAYHQFALAMQAGAFVQVIILFVAISSRMSVLSSQLEETLQLSISTCNRLLLVIEPTGTHGTVSEQLQALEAETPHPPHVEDDVSPKDNGQAVSQPRRESIDISTSVIEDLRPRMEATSVVRITPPQSHRTNTGNHATLQVSKSATAVKVAQKSRLKKAKKKFDEIDEIFGF